MQLALGEEGVAATADSANVIKQKLTPKGDKNHHHRLELRPWSAGGGEWSLQGHWPVRKPERPNLSTCSHT